MKKNILLITLFLFTIIGGTYAQNTWTQIVSFTTVDRTGAVSFVIGDKGYVGTGYSNGLTKDFWEYDPASDTWAQKADFIGVARTKAVGFSTEGKGYVGTGFIDPDWNHATDDFWEYNPITNSWTQKSNFPGGKRGAAVGFSIADKGYLGLGSTGASNNKKDFWEYDALTNTWTKKADFLGGHGYDAVAFTIGDKGYVGTGTDFGSTSPEYDKDFYEYDPLLNIWTQKADVGGIGRTGASGFSIGDKGYIGTGYVYDSSCSCFYLTNDFWEYDSENDSWIQKTDFGGSIRYEATGFSIVGAGYIGLGNGQFDFWQYTPDCETPAGLVTTNIKSTSAKVNWNIVPTAQTYNVRYRKTGTGPWTKVSALTNAKKLTGLSPSTQYDWSVKSVCDAVNHVSSDWSATQNFTTKPLRLDAGEEIHTPGVKVFPNPFASSTTISFSIGESSQATIEVFDLQGKKIKTLLDEDMEAGDYNIVLSRGELDAGIYFLKLTANNQASTMKIVVE